MMGELLTNSNFSAIKTSFQEPVNGVGHILKAD
jgi:hypothetical protein